MILVLFTIPDRTNPNPNISPTSDANIVSESWWLKMELIKQITIRTKLIINAIIAGIVLVFESTQCYGVSITELILNILLNCFSDAVIMPNDIKHSTAIDERIDNLGKPQTPWPLVHPFPNLVPKPTSRPAIIEPTIPISVISSILSNNGPDISGINFLLLKKEN